MATTVKVIVVDDEPDARFLIRQAVLEEPRIEVIGEAADGAEAIGLVEQLAPDVVVMDYKMPGMNGAEATEKIKERWPRVEVVGFTAAGTPSERLELLQAGALTRLDKNDLQELSDVIMQAARTD
jgi:DNA-binding NarL/FixJ family response regulator